MRTAFKPTNHCSTTALSHFRLLHIPLDRFSDKVSLSCFYVAWESYQYENILSLVVSCGWDADVNEYNVYLYDIASGQQLTTAGLLKALDVDETVFLEAVRRAAAAKFDTQYGAIAGGDTDEFLSLIHI